MEIHSIVKIYANEAAERIKNNLTPYSEKCKR